MDRIFEQNPSVTPPPLPSPALLGYPTETGTPTTPGAYWFYMITEELRAAVVAGGITPAAGTLNQLGAAITAIADGAVSAGLTGYATQAWVTSQNYATVAFASNASNLSSGTINNARLPAAITIGGQMAAASFNVTSDLTLKKNVQPITGALGRLSLYRGITYELEDSDEIHGGLPAQDFAKACPHGVRKREDGKLEVKVMSVVAEHTAALSEALELIRELQSRIAALEAR